MWRTVTVNQGESKRGLECLSIDLAGRTLETRTHERRNHRISKRVGAVGVVGTPVAT